MVKNMIMNETCLAYRYCQPLITSLRGPYKLLFPYKYKRDNTSLHEMNFIRGPFSVRHVKLVYIIIQAYYEKI